MGLITKLKLYCKNLKTLNTSFKLILEKLDIFYCLEINNNSIKWDNDILCTKIVTHIMKKIYSNSLLK